MQTLRPRASGACALSWSAERVCVVALVWVAALVCQAAPALALEDPAARTRQVTLDNGLTVLLLEQPTTPAVSFQIWVRAGSRDEARYTGIAHLFEHMMFKGSRHIAPEEHARLVQERGGRINAYTSRDVTVYWEDVTAESLPLVIDLEAERLANLDISAENLASEREVVLEERRMRTEDQPDGLGFQTLMALAFEAHPYRWPVIGWRSDVEAVPLEACRAFFRTYYAPNNLVIVVVGDFDADDTLAHIERAFGGLRPAEIPRNPTQEHEQRGERRAVVHFPVRAPLLMAVWHAPATGHPDGPALDVAGEVLSSGRSSRLYRRLVYEEQQALSASAGYWELADAGLFVATVGVRPDGDVERTEALLLEEIARLRAGAVSPAELDKARRRLEVALVNGLATANQLASRIGSDFVFQGRIRPLEERLEEIRSVSAEDVSRVARTYLVDRQRSSVRVVAPEPAAASADAPAASGIQP